MHTKRNERHIAFVLLIKILANFSFETKQKRFPMSVLTDKLLKLYKNSFFFNMTLYWEYLFLHNKFCTKHKVYSFNSITQNLLLKLHRIFCLKKFIKKQINSQISLVSTFPIGSG